MSYYVVYYDLGPDHDDMFYDRMYVPSDQDDKTREELVNALKSMNPNFNYIDCEYIDENKVISITNPPNNPLNNPPF